MQLAPQLTLQVLSFLQSKLMSEGSAAPATMPPSGLNEGPKVQTPPDEQLQSVEVQVHAPVQLGGLFFPHPPALTASAAPTTSAPQSEPNMRRARVIS